MTKGKPKKLGAVLKCYRLLKERNLRELAKEIGVSASTLCRLETGRAIDAETLVKILNWFLG
jgi:transcriptional regulator with XRE-family HTH domain